MLFGEKCAHTLGAGDHATTFGGNPVACAGALEVLGRIDEGLLQEVAEKGAYITRAVEGMPHVVSVEGKGLMLGVTLEGVNSREAAAALPRKGAHHPDRQGEAADAAPAHHHLSGNR